ncbi:MAG: hypothetical protein PHX70_06715 [Clostridium sp.]|nr:hypothetical protein [Clostridium sp.]
MDKFSIKNTTKEQREKIVRDSLGGDGVGCEVYGADDAYEMYKPYIDGKKEISEINNGFKYNLVR